MNPIVKPQDAWILHREDICTQKEGPCNLYFLLDAYSGYCFGQCLTVDLPSSSEVLGLLKEAYAKAHCWPKQILIDKKDPYREILKSLGHGLSVPVQMLPFKELEAWVQPLSEGLKESRFTMDTRSASAEEQETLKAFIPDTYGPCPCASGMKFKFCCQKAFQAITFAMCAAEEYNLKEALDYMKEAESKVGRTAEVLCRYAICWSYFDQKKSKNYLKEALAVNPDHPRTHYILGLEAKEQGQYQKAIRHYQQAIAHYPPSDRYHLNEAYNNMGSAYFELGDYEKAKEAWEKGLVLLPADAMVRRNLIENIYDNPAMQEGLRVIPPFMQQHLNRYGQA